VNEQGVLTITCNRAGG